MREAIRDDLDRPILGYLHERVVGGRRVQLRFALVEGRLVCIGLEIGPPLVANDKNARVFAAVDDAELNPLRSAEIRLPLRELIDEALERAVALSEKLVQMSPELEARWRRHSIAAKEGRKKPGRPPLYSDDHYKQVAAIYEETLRSGRRDPLKAVMRELKIEKTTAASKVREARRRGFLTIDYFGKEGTR
jgi:hypothetical protein